MVWWLLLACTKEETGGGTGTTPTTPVGGDPVAGEEVYGRVCATCHGADGSLGVEVEGVAASDLTFTVPLTTDANLEMIMRDGVGVMPPQLTDDTEIADTMAYLRQTFPM